MLVIVFFGNPRSDSAREGMSHRPMMTMLIVLAILARSADLHFSLETFSAPTEKEAAVLVPVQLSSL